MQNYNLIIRNGLIYDGSGGAPFRGDVAVQGDSIAAVGDLGDARATQEIDVNGLAVAPGFINMLSWSVESLIEDGRSQSEIRQGVTLEVMGEGTSMGPMSQKMKDDHVRGILGNSDINYDIEWTTLGEYLEWLEKRGVSTNITSFVGTSTLRIHVMGYDDRPPTENELDQMRDLVRTAMEEGAVGLSAALIYPPAAYADTGELIALASAAAEYDGLYISHIRGEGSTLLNAVDELIEIAQATGIRSEIYHLKAAGPANWHLMDGAIEKVEEARAEGLPITADLYSYDFSGTGLAACIPPWAHEGGDEALFARLRDPEGRKRIKRDLQTPSDEWENMYQQNGADKILLSGFRTEALKPLTGKTLAEVAAMRGTQPEDTLMDLIAEDESHLFSMYFTMSEDNLRKQMALPWVSFCSDAQSQAPEGVFLKSNPHPRAYGAFARVLGKYVRDEGIIPLEEAIRRLTSFPAANLKIEGRGSLKEGYYADVVVFDPAAIQDHATPYNPHQYATGMQHVFVNGVQVLKDGEHTGAKPGRVVRGPGYKRNNQVKRGRRCR
jgi:N-acyl-D-amino-acid deacylase